MRIRARSRILNYVAAHPGADATQIARSLGMNPPAVRHHLAILKSDGRVEAAAARRGPGRGRPKLEHRVSVVMAGNNLAMVADYLLEVSMRDAAGRRGESKVVAGLARRLVEQLPLPEPVPNAARRLAAVVNGLNELHYRSRWEAGAEGPRLIFGQCPYAAVIERHPELCQMDGQAIAGLMKAEVQQKAKIALRGAGASSCVFALKYM